MRGLDSRGIINGHDGPDMVHSYVRTGRRKQGITLVLDLKTGEFDGPGKKYLPHTENGFDYAQSEIYISYVCLLLEAPFHFFSLVNNALWSIHQADLDHIDIWLNFLGPCISIIPSQGWNVTVEKTYLSSSNYILPKA
jgi:hypothetical protein